MFLVKFSITNISIVLVADTVGKSTSSELPPFEFTKIQKRVCWVSLATETGKHERSGQN